jgi:hypothetical protein
LKPIKSDILVSKFAFKWVNLYRYIEENKEWSATVGLYKLNPVDP